MALVLEIIHFFLIVGAVVFGSYVLGLMCSGVLYLFLFPFILLAKKFNKPRWLTDDYFIDEVLKTSRYIFAVLIFLGYYTLEYLSYSNQ